MSTFWRSPMIAISFRLRQGIAERLEPLPEAQRMLAHHRLHLGQRLVGNVDITQPIRKSCQFQQGGGGLACEAGQLQQGGVGQRIS